MVTLEEAYRLAGGLLAEISGCAEWEDAWEFVNPRSAMSIGGPHLPVFILKASGECVTASAYFLEIGNGALLQENVPLPGIGGSEPPKTGQF